MQRYNIFMKQHHKKPNKTKAVTFFVCTFAMQNK